MSDPMVAVVLQLWQEVSGTDQTDPHRPLPAGDERARLTAALRALLAMDLHDEDLCEYGTPEALGAYLTACRTAARRTDGADCSEPGRAPAVRASPGQAALWLADQTATNRAAYTTPFVQRVPATVDLKALELALSRVVAAHEALRAVFRPDGDGLRVDVAGEASFAFRVHHCADGAEAERTVREAVDAEFDLARGPVLAVDCAVEAGGPVHIVCSVHHIAFDAASARPFLRDWWTAYDDVRAGRRSSLGGGVRFRDFAERHHAELAIREADDLTYWAGKLAGSLPVLDLPTDRPRPAAPRHTGDIVRFDLPPELAEALRARAADEGVTLFMLLLSAYAVFLAKHTRQPEVLIATPMSLRDRPELADTVGYLVNTVVLRCAVDDEVSLSDLHAQVRAEVTDAMTHRWTPLDKVVSRVRPPSGATRGPLFQTMFVLPDTDPSALADTGRKVDLDLYVRTAAQNDLTLLVERDGDTLRGVLDFDTELFDRRTAEAMAVRFRRVLETVAHRPDADVGDVALLDPDEQRRLVAELDPGADTTDPRPVIQLVEDWAARRPGAIALESDDETWTYAELDAAANRLARLLRTRGAGPSRRVGLLLHRSPRAITALLAVLKTGASYVPLDPAYPAERVGFMLSDSGARILVTDSAPPADLPTGPGAPTVLRLDSTADELAASSPAPLAPVTRIEDELYVVYTSGSTGRPKGVAMTGATITNLVREQEAHSYAGGAARTLQFMSLSFDVSVMEILGTLCFGGTLVLVDEHVRSDPPALAALVVRRRVARLYLPYIAVHQLAVVAENGGLEFPALREVASVGERLVTTPQIRAFAARHDRLALVNMYGPSETHLASVHHLAGDPATWEDAPPIGRPIRGLRMVPLDRRGVVVPAGVPGELAIGGNLLSPGYVGLPDETARRFVPDPYAEDGQLLYRTGDLVRWTPRDGFRYLGRVDEQISLRGFRIEPAEIEAALDDQPGVAASAVAARDFAPGDRRLVAYVVATDDRLAPDRIRAALRRRLPDHLVPAHVVTVGELPTTPSGKIDRNALPELGGPATTRVDSTPPRDALEQQVADVWCRLLGAGQMGVDQDFFEVGGHSVLATELLYALRGELGIEVGLAALLAEPTVAGMASAVRRLRDGGPAGDVTPDLTGQVVLPEHVRPPEDNVVTAPGEVREVLLTGATGFLGIYLLRDLLARTDARVHCLVRAVDNAQAWHRLRAHADEYGLLDDLPIHRVRAVAGDVSHERLGLDPDSYTHLARTVDVVHHAAAHINFVAPYASVRATNVEGLIRVLEFATAERLVPVHHMSTVGVFPPAPGRQVVSETDNPQDPTGLSIGYTQSKWVAERIADLARDRGVPVTVYRMSRVFADSVSGICQADDFLWRQIESFIRLGKAPESLPPTNLLPVDFVSACVVALSLREDVAGRTWHIVHPEETDPDVIREGVREAGYDLATVPDGDWFAALESEAAGPSGGGLASTAPLLREGALDVGTFVYESRRTAEVVEACGLRYPEVGSDLIRKVIDSFRSIREPAT